jgi:Protein kinase domain
VSHPVDVGGRLGGYRLDAVAGRGGMGVVYRATQLELDRVVAVKVISPGLAADPVFRERFKREARMLAAVDHPHVIPIHEAGEIDGTLFMSMRWIDGRDLAREIRDANGLDPPRALAILEQIAGGLDTVHEHGLVHRDLKPANVLLETRPDGEHAYLTDFGAGRQLEVPSDMTATGHWLGTVDYAAPEVLDGAPAGPRSDLYALGCVLFEALAGAPPFHRDTPLATMAAHRRDPPPSLHSRRPGLPPALDAVFARALAKDPAQRYSTAQRLVEAGSDALAAAHGRPTEASESPVPPAVARDRGGARWARRSGLAMAAVAIIILAVVGVIVLDPFGDDAPRSSRQADGTAEAVRITRVPLGEGAIAAFISSDERRTYVLDLGARAVVAVDNVSRRVSSRIALPAEPRSLALDRDGGRLWVGLRDRRLVPISLRDERVSGRPLKVSVPPDELAMLGRILIVADKDPLRLVRIDPERRRQIGEVVAPGGAATGMLTYGGSVLVTTFLPPTLQRYDADLRRVASHGLDVSMAADLAVDPSGLVWIPAYEERTVIRVDPAGGELRGAPIPVGREPFDVAFDGSSAWVTNKGDNTITRIDLDSGRRVGSPIRTDFLGGPIAARWDAIRGGVWVSAGDQLLELEPRRPLE